MKKLCLSPLLAAYAVDAFAPQSAIHTAAGGCGGGAGGGGTGNLGTTMGSHNVTITGACGAYSSTLSVSSTVQ
jgi:hypothetical protein